MITEGRSLAGIADNVTVKVPLTMDGLKACKALTEAGTMVNVTLCFSANQALLAAKAGATFVSPFIGRLDDIGLDGVEADRGGPPPLHDHRRQLQGVVGEPGVATAPLGEGGGRLRVERQAPVADAALGVSQATSSVDATAAARKARSPARLRPGWRGSQRSSR